jgi:hypothetical protein
MIPGHRYWPPYMHGQCFYYINNKNSIFCRYEPGWSDVQCEGSTCHCESCMNGGQCVSVDVGYASKQKMKSVCIFPNVKVIDVKININKLVYWYIISSQTDYSIHTVNSFRCCSKSCSVNYYFSIYYHTSYSFSSLFIYY